MSNLHNIMIYKKVKIKMITIFLMFLDKKKNKLAFYKIYYILLFKYKNFKPKEINFFKPDTDNVDFSILY